ncbi:hypothetical protein CTP10_R62010 (plasmid) [Cupriavidus sp. P-10]|uniref:hypothetical protein n=1 Tax=Cupriavidus sp. P-10 TaxID=2027911 RepID=UPI00218C75C6|nr:hypothetical protein [Cupriavidus sp. P-10]BDB28789.1 hypothetical protein CTP10_R62010 [Cupriavidus sp. P-10]
MSPAALLDARTLSVVHPPATVRSSTPAGFKGENLTGTRLELRSERISKNHRSWPLVALAVAIRRLAQRAIGHPGISQAVDVAIGMMLLNTPANPAEGASSGIVSLG